MHSKSQFSLRKRFWGDCRGSMCVSVCMCVCVCMYVCVYDKSMTQSAFWISTLHFPKIIKYHYMCVSAFHHFLLQAINNTAMYFSLPGNGSLYTSKPLDRELSQWHNLTVIAAEISKMNFMCIIFSIILGFILY